MGEQRPKPSQSSLFFSNQFTFTLGNLEKAYSATFLLKIRIAWWIAREPRKSQREGQEDQGILKQLGGTPELFYFSMVLLPFLLS